MTTDPYSADVRRLFAEPRHAGDLEDAVSVYAADQGVRVSLQARFAAGALAALRFRAWGCPHLIAAAEAFCENYEGRPLSDLEGFSALEIMQTLSVPVEKTGRILVLEDAVRSLGLNARGGSNPDQGK